MNASPWVRKRLVAAIEDAAVFFREHLLGLEGHGPREYLTNRGFASLLDETTPWTVGYAPASWTALHDYLCELGYSDDHQLAAGVITMSRHGKPIDRFRDRITFGIRDTDGALVGFVARSSPGAPPQAPRYLNTPTTAIYNKRRSLFGIGEQVDSLRANATPVLVEGPLDAIAIERASCTSASSLAGLALCGSACTDQQVNAALIGAPGEVVLMFDPDSAGHRALCDAYRRLRPRVAKVKAVAQFTETDPADLFFSGGPLAVLRRLQQTRPAGDVIVDLQLQTWPAHQSGIEADLARLREVAATIVGLGGSDVAHHAARLRQLLPFDDMTVAGELADALRRNASARRGRHRVSAAPTRQME